MAVAGDLDPSLFHFEFGAPVLLSSKGRCSSVSKHPTENLAVSVYDVTLSPYLYYRVGVVTGRSTTWGTAVQYDTGKRPSVALFRSDNDFYVIETHMSDVRDQCYYSIGKVDIVRKRISWCDNNTGICNAGSASALAFHRGKKPKVSANDAGDIIIIFEETYNKNSILFCYGKFKIINEGVPNITWKSDCSLLASFHGVEPDIALNMNKEVAVICRSGSGASNSERFTIKSAVGKLNAANGLTLSQTSFRDLPNKGINPSISINDKGCLAECHQSWTGRHLYSFCGNVSGGWNQGPESYSNGEYPTISIDDNRFVMEMHKTSLGTPFHQPLYQLQGTFWLGTPVNETSNTEEAQQTQHAHQLLNNPPIMATENNN